MAVILIDFAILFVVLGGVAIFILRSSIRRDREEQAAHEVRERQVREAAMRNKTRVPLICIGCNTQFTGFPSGAVCPTCQSETLVLTMEDYSRRQQQANRTK